MGTYTFQYVHVHNEPINTNNNAKYTCNSHALDIFSNDRSTNTFEEHILTTDTFKPNE